MRLLVPTILLLMPLAMACGARAPAPATPAPATPAPASAPPQGRASHEGGWTLDGSPVSRDVFAKRMAEFNVDTKPAYSETIASPKGGYGGSEAQYVAVHKTTRALYTYTIVNAEDGRAYHDLSKDETTPKQPTPKQPTPTPTATVSSSESFVLNGEEVDKATFEAKLRTLKVDAEPWVNAHMTNSNGESGGAATYEAVDRRTGQRWTYKVESIGRHSSRHLSPGSRKDKDGAIQ